MMMKAMAKTVPPAFFMPWQVMVLAAVAVFVISILASLISIRRVLVLEPAIVFK
jgi:putative ABC transport system permease protein